MNWGYFWTLCSVYITRYVTRVLQMYSYETTKQNIETFLKKYK